jgi:hypothetical protein
MSMLTTVGTANAATSFGTGSSVIFRYWESSFFILFSSQIST